ncbi:hypothetical protein TIFTF001_042293 [Ficus carica]|uniref:Uncharacterized protein n=2 Tax=Ficus carica TaxID=3494 RepID=A0AA87ZF72_FICCA|nr:hypothetical protein TIFTF001_042293 [Ficus carica]
MGGRRAAGGGGGWGETGGGGPGVGGAPGKLGGRGAVWGPAGEGCGREEKREKGEEKEMGVAGGRPGLGPVVGGPKVGRWRPSPATEKTLDGKGNVR